jgi:hypothetical protein
MLLKKYQRQAAQRTWAGALKVCASPNRTEIAGGGNHQELTSAGDKFDGLPQPGHQN